MIISETKTGDILLYEGHSTISPFIKFFSKSPYSHSGIIFDSWNSPFVAEADSQGVLPNTIETSIKGSEILVLRPVFDFDPKALDILITSHLGKHRYGFSLLLFVQLVYQLSGRRIWLSYGDNNDQLKRTICGQFVAYIWHVYSKEELFKDWWKATPASLFSSQLFTQYQLTQ